MPLMAYEQPLLTVVPAVELVKVWGRADMVGTSGPITSSPLGTVGVTDPRGVVGRHVLVDHELVEHGGIATDRRHPGGPSLHFGGILHELTLEDRAVVSGLGLCYAITVARIAGGRC